LNYCKIASVSVVECFKGILMNPEVLQEIHLTGNNINDETFIEVVGLLI